MHGRFYTEPTKQKSLILIPKKIVFFFLKYKKVAIGLDTFSPILAKIGNFNKELVLSNFNKKLVKYGNNATNIHLEK